jgi:hypothetical protein
MIIIIIGAGERSHSVFFSSRCSFHYAPVYMGGRAGHCTAGCTDGCSRVCTHLYPTGPGMERRSIIKHCIRCECMGTAAKNQPMAMMHDGQTFVVIANACLDYL